MNKAQEVQSIISQATGTTQYHRFSKLPKFPLITDGVLAVAEAAGCYWLLDVIGSYQHDPRLCRDFQVWKLEVNRENDSGVVRGYNDTTLIITQDIPYTDFPLDEIKLYLVAGVLLLPSEY